MSEIESCNVQETVLNHCVLYMHTCVYVCVCVCVCVS